MISGMVGRRLARVETTVAERSDALAHDGELAPSPPGWAAAVQQLDVGEALRESEARLQALLSSLDDLVFELDRDGNYLGVWTVRDDLLVAPRNELLGRNIAAFIGEELADDLVLRIRRSISTGVPEIMEYSLEVAAGMRWFQARMAPIAAAAHSVCFLSRDITGTRIAEQAREDAEERLRQQALHDGLTGLPNRTQFLERLEQALWASRSSHAPLAVLMLDVDRFKEVNDTLGHAAGDIVLTAIAERLRKVSRAGDLVARLGGDEFAILLLDAGDEDAATVATRVAACADSSIAVDGVLLNVDISTGIAVGPRDGQEADALMRRADIAMYAAKRRSRFGPHDESGHRQSPERLALIGELQGALERGELVVYYQPVIELSTGTVTKVEALVRWLHPHRGVVPPDQFIPLIEETGLMQSLTHHVLELALQQCRTWLDSGRSIGVAVNLAMRDLVDVSFPDDVAKLLEKYRVPAHMLSLEITEQSVMADPRRTKEILDRLSEMGVHLAVDDFGTGYSSLTYLTRLPVDEVKIDRSFVTNMASVPADEVVVRSTIELARSLCKAVVAEGVETAQVLQQLVDLGCDAAQGFFMSRPLPAGELDRWMSGELTGHSQSKGVGTQGIAPDRGSRPPK